MANYHPAAEEYLGTIFELEESGISPLRARLVERLGVSAPAVSETVKRLEREGYLTLDGNRVMRLTDKGRQFATAVMRRHRLAERLLVEVLKVPWHQVHDEAARLEHAISANLEQHLVRLLNDPATCPHGNPIPGSTNAVDIGPLYPLASVSAGTEVVVHRIDEELEAQHDRMFELEQAGIIPPLPATVVASDDAGVRLAFADRQVRLVPAVATLVYATVPAAEGLAAVG